MDSFKLKSHISNLKPPSQKSHTQNPCEHQHLGKDAELGEMGFAVSHVDFVHKNKKEDTQAPKIKVELSVVDFESNDQNRTDKTECNEEYNSFGIAEAKDNRKGAATVFSVSLPVFNVFDDFSYQVDKKSEYSVGQHKEFGLLVVITDDPNGSPSQ